MLSLVLLVTLAAAEAPAAPVAAASQKAVVDLPALLEKARNQPVVETARASAKAAHAKASEIKWMWGPQIEITAVGGPSQRIQCWPSVDNCQRTTPDQAGLGFDGVFGRLDGRLLMPVYTFGKITDGQRAAEAGAVAADALAEASAQGAALDAAKAYFAVKLGRELLLMLDEAAGLVDDELKREEELLSQGSGDITEADHRRVLTLRAEIDARRSQARKVEELGLAGVHYTLGTAAADVDAVPLQAVEWKLPTVAEIRELSSGRPEHVAAKAGEEAMAGLVDVEWDKWWPDVVIAGQGTLAASNSVDHPRNAFMVDPFNVTTGAIGLVIRWAPEPFQRLQKIDQAEAEHAKAKATRQMAREGLAAEAEKTLAEARDAFETMKAGKVGEKHSKAWLASVLQSEAAGLVEAKDLADALLQYFMMRARRMQAMFEWNVAVVSLHRAIGKQPSELKYVEED